MNYADIKKCDVANGPGVRVSLFVSGCTHHCKGCFNPETWSFSYGQPFTKESVETILEALAPDYIKGFTLLGGEPFEPQNQEEEVKLLRRIRQSFPEKSIWCFTGYRFDQDILGVMKQRDPYAMELLSYIDVLVDGEFVEEQKDLSLRFRGSGNQRQILVKESLKKGTIVYWEDGREKQDASQNKEMTKGDGR